MTTFEGRLEEAWAGWSQALINNLFPGGLGGGQHFSFGQTTLIADFANTDSQVANAEIFRIGDTVPAMAPSFAPTASLSEAYGFFLELVASPQLAMARANLVAANSASQTAFNMPAKVCMQLLVGDQSAEQVSAAEAALTTFLPGYELDTGFQAKYQEWQNSSIAGRTQDGGVIRFSSTIASIASLPAAQAAVQRLAPVSMLLTTAVTITPTSAAPEQFSIQSFFRILTPAPAKMQSAMTATGTVTPTLLRASGDSLTPVPLAAAGGSGQFSLEVSFTGLGTFMLSPTRWFSNTVVRLFEGQLSPENHALFFAENGVLARRIYQVVIGFEPAVTLRFDDRQAFENAKTLLSLPQGASIGIGPLSFDAGQAVSTGSDDTHTITLGRTASTLPILLGVVSTNVVNFLPTVDAD